MSLGEMAGSGFASKYTVNKPSYEYTRAVEKVQAQPKGTLISKAKTVVAIPAVPTIIGNLISNPLPTVVGGIWDTMFGSKEGQVKQASGFIPAAYQLEYTKDGITETTIKPVPQVLEAIIDKQKGTTEGASFWESPGMGPGSAVAATLPSIELPDIGGFLDTAKWAVIGIAALIGGYIVVKAFGGKK